MKMYIDGVERNIAYFIPLDGKTDKGWMIAIAAEGLPQYYGTDWFYDCEYDKAVELINDFNAHRGITKEETDRIIDSSVLASMVR